MSKAGTGKLKGDMMLLVAAIIWGMAFIAQSKGMDHVGPITFQGVRSLLGCLTLIPVILFMDSGKKRSGTYHSMSRAERKTLYMGGALCGISLCAAALTQQYGILYTEVGKAGFITSMYILIVPVMGLFLKKKVPVKIWFCIMLALVGLYFLCIKKGSPLNHGDVLMIIAAFLFSIQILFVDYFSPKVDGVRLSFLQFLVTGVLSTIMMFFFENPDWNNILAAWPMIAYAGIASCGVAYTFQIIGQKYTDPAVASLIMSLESVFAVIGGVLVLHQFPSSKEWLGITLMFSAILISQISRRKN